MPNAQHHKARRLVRQRLFSGVSAFCQLERRIADLPDEMSRGDAFEVFAEAYFATARKHDAQTVWPLTSIPGEVLKNLQLAIQDYGVDGVLKTHLGRFSAYQVKFRTGRQPLTWRELSTFIGLADSPNIHGRMLITNSDELPAVLNDRQGFYCIRGSDLDRLEAEDFKAIEAWLADSAYQAPKKTPQPHQAEALDAIVPAFAANDRVSAIMACGTGKTLVALWTVERMQVSHVLVLVPSLALLRQILHQWLHETNLPALAYMCVCCDPTVTEGLDSIDTKQSELDFEVSTNTASVREFLDAPFNGTKVIFSTYQSAQVVGMALKPGESFELGVFDEAHKTAGREGRNYAFGLEDPNLPIRKRLFLTATPRHYNPHQHDREGDAQLVFSMDRPEVYGPQVFRLTFAEAAQRKIICGYKVIISVITSEIVTNELLSRGEVLVNGDAVRARQVANQIALRDAVDKYGVNKVFTFHKTVESAASFVAGGSEGVRTHLPEFSTFHVNGTMPTVQRERQMRDFRAATRAIMSNARCLTEGVDVAAVDMVAFLSPRRSRVDIVQATGRAMRCSPGKATGYVLVPLYVELSSGESVESAVSRAQFDEVWDVLNSLQEQDDVLAERIQCFGQQRGRGGGFDDRQFADLIEIDSRHLELGVLLTAVATRCLEKLYSSWDIWFGRLQLFQEQFRHCCVSKSRAKKYRALARWASGQRALRNKGKLGEHRIRRLDSIGFIWSVRDLRWYKMLDQYRELKQKHGHRYGILSFKKYRSLRSWIRNQRIALSERKLEKTKVAALIEAGFVSERHTSSNDWILEELTIYHKQHGDCFVPFGHSKHNHVTNELLELARLHRRRRLSPRLIEELNKLGMRWEIHDLKWHIYYSSLKYCRATYGHLNVPEDWSKYRGVNFISWCRQQRLAKHEGRLEQEKVKLLEQIGFSWEAVRTPEELAARKLREKQNWDQCYLELQQYFAEEEKIIFPFGSRHIALKNWLRRQIAAGQADRLAGDQMQKLEVLGVKWDVDEFDWLCEWATAKEYFDEHGDLKRVASRTVGWLRQQQALFIKRSLSFERVELLKQLDFHLSMEKA